MNAPQAQFSTEEQLEWLRAFYNGLNNKPQTAAALIRLANVQGFYDAADCIQVRAKDAVIPEWFECGATSLEKLMEW